MRPIKLFTIAIAALLLIGAAAAVGTATPAEQANDSATDVVDENASSAGNASAHADNATEQVGPTGELPDPAPDFVSQLHSTIERFLNGSIDHLGDALHGLLSPGQASDAAAV